MQYYLLIGKAYIVNSMSRLQLMYCIKPYLRLDFERVLLLVVELLGKITTLRGEAAARRKLSLLEKLAEGKKLEKFPHSFRCGHVVVSKKQQSN